MLPLFESILLSLIKQVCLGRAQIHNFRTSLSIFPQLYAFPAVVRIRDAWVSAYDASALKASVIAFVANMNQSIGIDKTITNHALSVAYQKKRNIHCKTSVPTKRQHGISAAVTVVVETRTLFTEATDGNSWLLPAHDEIWVMFGHGDEWMLCKSLLAVLCKSIVV